MRSWLSGDSGLSAVKPVVFLRNLIKVDTQAVSDLAQGNRHAARAEVVTALDETAGLAAAEQPLESLRRRGRCPSAPRHRNARGSRGCAPKRPDRAADAIAAGAPAQKDDDVARLGLLATHVIGRGRRDDGADLHALCDIARMIQLVDRACGQADLVAAVGTGSRRRPSSSLRCGSLPSSVTDLFEAVVTTPASCCAWYTWLRPESRVADSYRQTRCRATAERLGVSVGWLCVSFLKVKPVLVASRRRRPYTSPCRR